MNDQGTVRRIIPFDPPAAEPQSSLTARHSRPRGRWRFERRIQLLAFLAGLPAAVVALALLWVGDFAPRTQWTLSLIVVGGWAACAAALVHRVVYPLRTISNMLAALREGDFSLRGRGARSDDALGEVLLEVNALSQTLREQRLGAVEATTLLRKVVDEIDVAVFAFDAQRKLRLANVSGRRLLGLTDERPSGRTAEELGLDACLSGEPARAADIAFPGAAGRWELRRTAFRMAGRTHQLLVLSDLTRALREEERQAWKRLVQVLRHEINNSLAPIDSLAGSLGGLLKRQPRPADWESDLAEGLTVIRERSKALNRFMTAYSRLTRLPKPHLARVDVGAWVGRVVGLEPRLKVVVVPGPAASIPADIDQLDQLLINLVRNAVDAALETGGGVCVGWRLAGPAPAFVDVWVEDEGPGLSDSENLFVPFFTTKPDGAGIGLPLSRQIAEAHGGRLHLENRTDRRGCRACLRLPVAQAISSSNAAGEQRVP